VIRVLVVDDSALVRKLLGGVFKGEPDFQVRVARNGLEALEQLAAFKPDVITLDVHMPEMDGLACLDRIMVERPCPVVMVSSLTEDGAEATLEALRLGAVDFAAKPGGAVSLKMDAFGRELLAKVRAAAGAKVRLATRLRDRVRRQIGDRPLPEPAAAPLRVASRKPRAPSGEGLVLVGTSTGGPPALEALLTPLSAGFRWPIVIAQHMPKSFTGALARRLDGLCAISVVEVTGPTVLEPGCAYIGRGEADVIISRRAGVLSAMAAPARADYPWHPSTDRLVRSALEHLPASRIVGVLMTGMGYDGAQAMTLVHEKGGRTIAEAQETAVVWGMPGELVKANGATAILPLHEIAEGLQRMVG
jgi:two-component system chemotaxis response regulator CheB